MTKCRKTPRYYFVVTPTEQTLHISAINRESHTSHKTLDSEKQCFGK